MPYGLPGGAVAGPADILEHLAMLVNGVDLGGWMGGLVSAQHGEAEMRQTVAAFSRTLAMLKDEGEI